jgi:hypothetical protein
VKGDPKNYIPNIASTFTAWKEVAKYTRMVSREEIEKKISTSLPAGTFKRPNQRNIPELRGARFAFKCSGDALRTIKSKMAQQRSKVHKVGLLFLL